MVNVNKAGLKNKGEAIATIIFNLIFLWVLSMVPGWQLAFLKSNYMVVLTILQINCVVQIALAVLLLIIDPRGLRLFVKAVSEAAGLVALVMMYYLYPFNFSNVNLSWIDKILPALLVLAMIVAIGKIISYFFILLFRSRDNSTAQE